MAPSSAQIKSLVTQFHDLSGAPERVASRYLKATNYRLDAALDSYYAGNNDAKPSPLETRLSSLFDSLRDAKNDEKDKMEVNSTMSYLGQKLGVSLENAELFVVLELVQAPSVGEITRAGFIEGWKATRAEATVEAQAAYVQNLISSLSSDPAYFKKVYKHVFVAGREGDQKALGLDVAQVYWGILFSEPGLKWTSPKYDWLDLWKKFLAEKWTRSVNRDMWNMTLEFALKSKEDESLSFWNEDGAWPSVIDDFVEWCKNNGIGGGPGPAPVVRSTMMDLDDIN
ncbi:unnamed protein product [Clonostachys byssicola]|uniref:Defective in cullin neddylation protein n=1 Tax=Clonostachys byssicola TaxID=160290 RepID=A0A9N9UZX2_9HYPO|nr:unnamed protein product [Clonostachys byssicola]